MTQVQAKLLGTIIAAGLITAVVTGITFFMALPIFTAQALSWMFFGGLISAAIAAFCMAMLSIWNVDF